MRHLLLAVTLIVGSPLAQGGQATVNFTPPTLDANGVALTGASVITRYRIEYGTCNGTAFGTKVSEVFAVPPAVKATIQNLPAGTWCFRLYAQNQWGESAVSNVGTRLVPGAPPGPAVITTIEVSPTG